METTAPAGIRTGSMTSAPVLASWQVFALYVVERVHPAIPQ